ncbi:MAG: MATE family efflux transporter [Epsilonproteobacteria bacterium]|nr:MATE family efflux transporter [Campylobacterota bacterium]
MNREILRLAIPNILSNISVPLLSTVDTALMGHQSSLHLAAVGIAAMVFNLIYWNFGFLRMGTTGMTAQAYGKKDPQKLTNTLSRALFLSLIISLLLILFQEPIIRFIAYAMNVEDSYYPMVEAYFDIRIYAAPATLALYVLFGWFFGVQNAIIPLILTIFINLINIFFSYYFVNVLELGIDGVAYGTLIAQYAGLVLGFLFLYRYKRELVNIKLKAIFDRAQLSKFLNINRDIFIRTVALTFAFAFFYAQSAKEGEMALAITVILLQFLSWISFAIDGFAYATESLVGKYFGAKNWEKFNQAIYYSFYWGFGLASLYALFYYFGGEWILALYTDKIELIEATKPYLLWTVVMGFAGIGAFIWDGVFIGMTASRSMRDSVLYALLFFITLFYFVQPYHSLHLYWLSFILFLLMRGVIQSWMFWRLGRKLG